MVLMDAQILKENDYQRQNDTLILWTEPDGRDMALSFQSPLGCQETWYCNTTMK